MINKRVLIELRLQKMTYKEIGERFGVSRQRIHQLIKLLRKQYPDLPIGTVGIKHQNGLKKCSTCKQWLSLSHFHKSKSRWDGLNTYCRDCNTIKQRLYYKRYPDKIKSINKKQVEKWKLKTNARSRAYIRIPIRQKCEVEGCSRLGQRHHVDYDNDIIQFLCPLHHKRYHPATPS